MVDSLEDHPELVGQRIIRAKAPRGKFNYVDRQVEIPDLPEGMLDLGLASGGREVLIDLFDLHPHLLVAYERQPLPPRSVISRMGAMSVRPSCFRSTPSM